MKHSIIIPHLNRNDRLRQCLLSLWRSAAACGVTDYEIVIVDSGSAERPMPGPNLSLILCDDKPPITLAPTDPVPYWKTRFLNVGIEAAKGDALTFLDADAVVGERFMDNVDRLNAEREVVCINPEPKTPTRLAYRVRYSPIDSGRWTPSLWQIAFATYDDNDLEGKPLWPLGFEGYGEPHIDYRGVEPKASPCFGNSQFSILRSTLGDLRFDENYFGRGYEDIALNRALWQRDEAAYDCEMVADAADAMFHIQNHPEPNYAVDRWATRNYRRYYGKRMVWCVADDQATLRRFSNAIYCIPQLPCGFAFVKIDDWMHRANERNPGDRVVYEKHGGVWYDNHQPLTNWLAVLTYLGVRGTHCQLQESLKQWENG